MSLSKRLDHVESRVVPREREPITEIIFQFRSVDCQVEDEEMHDQDNADCTCGFLPYWSV